MGEFVLWNLPLDSVAGSFLLGILMPFTGRVGKPGLLLRKDQSLQSRPLLKFISMEQ